MNFIFYDLETTGRNSTWDQIIQVAAILVDKNFNELERFESIFKFSKLSRLIDTCEASIISNITTVALRRKMTPRYNVSAQYLIKLIKY